MKTSCPPEIELPTVEECREEAWKIEYDELLRMCVLRQCEAIKVTCGEWSRQKCAERIQLELQDIHYDGKTLSGRLLVGVREGQLRLNKQLVSDVHAEVRYPVNCRTGLPVKYIIWDSFPPRRQEDLLVLERGYWFGKEMDFPLFDEHFTGLGPECLKAELWLFTFDGQIAGHTEIRAERPALPASDAGIPEGSPDGGVPEEPSDAGIVDVNLTGSAGP